MPDFYLDASGQKHFRPGAPGRIDGSSVATPGPASKGTVFLLYEGARGGEPLVPRAVTSGSDLSSILTARDAKVFGHCAFTPCNDEQVPAGVESLVLVRVNPATRAQLALVNGDGDAVLAKANDWGLYGNALQVKVESGTTGKKVTVKQGADEAYVDNVGVKPALKVAYTAPVGAVPAGWAVAGLTVAVDPNAVNGDDGVTVAYSVTGPAAAQATDPRGWMAFDGPVTIAIGAQDAGVSRLFEITGTLKVAAGAKAAGETDTEIVEVDSASSATSTKSWAEVSAIEPPATMQGDATYTGKAFSLPINTAGGAAAYRTITACADKINQKTARGFLATLQTAESGLLVTNLDKVTAQSIVGAGYTLTAALYDFLVKCNTNLPWVSFFRATGATGLPSNVAFTNLAGGADGSAVQADWDAGLRAIEDLEGNTVVPWSSDPAVHAAVLAHCTFMAGKGQDERDCCLGVPGGTARGTSAGQLYALRLALANRNVSLYCQKPVIYDENGEELTLEPYALALMAAAADAGRVKGAGLTRKYLNVIRVEDHPGAAATNWTVKANGDELIENGYALVELAKRPRAGYRILRANTSYGADTNPFFSSKTANGAANRSSKNLRAVLDLAIGQENTVPVKILESAARKELERQVDAGELLRWASLEMRESGNTVSLSVQVQPPEERLWAPYTLNLVRF